MNETESYFYTNFHYLIKANNCKPCKVCKKRFQGVKKKIRKDSGWKDYWSSSPKIKAWIEESGTSDFSREILQFVTSKGMLAYAEEYALYTMGVLESDDWLNDNIRSKVYRTWVKRDEAVQLRKLLEDMKKGS